MVGFFFLHSENLTHNWSAVSALTAFSSFPCCYKTSMISPHRSDVTHLTVIHETYRNVLFPLCFLHCFIFFFLLSSNLLVLKLDIWNVHMRAVDGNERSFVFSFVEFSTVWLKFWYIFILKLYIFCLFVIQFYVFDSKTRNWLQICPHVSTLMIGNKQTHSYYYV